MIERDLPILLQEIEDAVDRADAAGLTVDRIDTTDMLGIRLSNTTDNAVDTGAALNTLLNTLLPDTDLGPIAPFQGTFQRETEAVGENEFELQLTVDGDLLLQTVQAQAPGNRQLSTPDGAREVIAIDYTATLPGEVKETNGATIDNNTVRWGIPLGGITTIDATSTIGKETPWFWLLVTLSLAAGLTVVIAVFATTTLINRRHRGMTRLRIAPGLSDTSDQQIMSASKPPTSVGDVVDALARLVRRMFAGRRTSQAAAPPNTIAEVEQEHVDGVHAKRD